jgi:hypothetical protein
MFLSELSCPLDDVTRDCCRSEVLLEAAFTLDSTSLDLVRAADAYFENISRVKDCMSMHKFIHLSLFMKQFGIRVCIELETISLAPSENIILLLV